MSSRQKILSLTLVLVAIVLAGVSGYLAAAATADPLPAYSLDYYPQAHVLCLTPYADVYDDGPEVPAVLLTISDLDSSPILLRASIPARDYRRHPYARQCVLLPAAQIAAWKAGSYRWCVSPPQDPSTILGAGECIRRPVDRAWRA